MENRQIKNTLRDCVINNHHYTTGGNSNKYFKTEAIDITNPLILPNTANTRENNNTFVWWNDHRVEFGVDNCATRHICSKKELFVGEINTSTNIGVKGISGSFRTTSLGTIRFTIKDDEDKVNEIILEHVIYLPEAAKNLILIVQWDEDKDDDCEKRSKGKF